MTVCSVVVVVVVKHRTNLCLRLLQKCLVLRIYRKKRSQHGVLYDLCLEPGGLDDYPEQKDCGQKDLDGEKDQVSPPNDDKAFDVKGGAGLIEAGVVAKSVFLIFCL